MTATFVAIDWITSISCVITMIVTPNSRFTRLSSASTSCVVSGSSALVASSASSSRGEVASARAMPTRCFCPPDSWSGKFLALSARPTKSSSSATRAATSAFDAPATFSGYATFCQTVFEPNRLNCWKIMPMPSRMPRSSRSGISVRSRPSTVMRPDVAGSSAFTRRTSVDLPAPE